MALGDNNSQAERWLDEQGGHRDRKTVNQVRLELQALPDEYVGDLPAAVQSYWLNLHNEALQASIPTYVRTATVAAHEERLDGVNPNYGEYRIEQLNPGSKPADGAQGGADQSSQAQQLHLEDLLSLAQEWKEHLVFDVGDAIFVQESKVPTSFSKGDGTAGWHEKGPIVWLVGHDGDVEVWLAVERRHRLFGALLEHLPHDVADTYHAIKDKIRTEITEMMESQAARISVTGLPSLVSELAEKLDVVLDSRMFGGNCEVCRRIADQDVI
jgi:hypothetical protein